MDVGYQREVVLAATHLSVGWQSWHPKHYKRLEVHETFVDWQLLREAAPTLGKETQLPEKLTLRLVSTTPPTKSSGLCLLWGFCLRPVCDRMVDNQSDTPQLRICQAYDHSGLRWSGPGLID